jgi:hypothetical protein
VWSIILDSDRSFTLKRLATLALAFAGLCNLNSATAGLVTNGSFEADAIPSGTFAYLPSITGWTLASGPAIEIQNHVAGSPFDGNQFVELDSSANSGMYQDIATVAGQTYQLSFAYSPRPGVAESSNGIDIRWGGLDLGIIKQTGIGHSDTVWSIHTYDLTATSSLTRLEFTATGTSDSYGGYLDAVSVNSVPEPASVAMTAMGIGAMLGAYRIRRRKVATA